MNGDNAPAQMAALKVSRTRRCAVGLSMINPSWADKRTGSLHAGAGGALASVPWNRTGADIDEQLPAKNRHHLDWIAVCSKAFFTLLSVCLPMRPSAISR